MTFPLFFYPLCRHTIAVVSGRGPPAGASDKPTVKPKNCSQYR